MAEKKHTKHRLSKIDTLPEALKAQLHMLLREGQMSQEEVRRQINEIIVEHGVSSDDEYIKRNGMSRYAQQFRKGMESMMQAQQMTKQWVAQFGEVPQTDIARLLIEIGKGQIFEYQMKALETDKPIDPKTLSVLSLAIKRLQEAHSGSVKLEQEIRKRFAEEAANAISDELRGVDGMSEQLEDRIRGILVGKA
ncbi:TPA: DUF3486 family protein [Vibrio cholerae]